LWKFDLPLFGSSKVRVATKNKSYRSGKPEKYSLSIECLNALKVKVIQQARLEKKHKEI